ncbi:sugar ABC transporter permease [Streptomyces sp. NBC_01260]|uniref:carbohydrate ABC transporter permease n=1 Tax=unclassified Streptomyces TaxID=2593676 RepID=UPI001F14C4DE|nr:MULTISPECIES: sugar ABC transporter permease [unclassified Streptomyces]
MRPSNATLSAPGASDSPPVHERPRRTQHTPPRPLRVRAARSLSSIFMVGPALAAVVAFILIPVVVAGRLSLTDWDGFSDSYKSLGLDNYVQLFHDPGVKNAAYVTLVIAAVGTVACNVLGLGLAVMLNGEGRVKAILRGLFFYPHVLGAVIIGFLWSAILSSEGAINTLLNAAHRSKIPFLSDPHWALASVVFVVIWSTFGVNVVLYLAGLQTIPESLLEAARIDGASRWQTFRQVVLPMLAPTVTINVVLVLVQLLRVYDLVLAMTDGGPAGHTQTYAYLVLSESFLNGKIGYASAQSIVLMIVITVLAIVVVTLRQRSEKAVEQ